MADTETDNVIPLQPPGATPGTQSRRKRDSRAAARRAKYRSKNKADRDATVQPAVPKSADIPADISRDISPVEIDTVTPPARAEAGVSNLLNFQEIAAHHVRDTTPRQTVERQPRYASIPLAVIAYGFFLLGVSINVWNAWTGGPIANTLLPALMGVLAESVMFFLPERTISLPLIGKVLAWVFLAFVATFALTNSLRMASIVSADQAAARADRQTEGVRTADQALEAARARRDEACGRGLGKTVACGSRQAEVAKLEAKQTQAINKVAAQAKPESADFARLVAWGSGGRLRPGADDFDMLWLLFRTLLPQLGGLVLMLARR
jgi:hypothetical protein